MSCLQVTLSLEKATGVFHLLLGNVVHPLGKRVIFHNGVVGGVGYLVGGFVLRIEFTLCDFTNVSVLCV